MSDPFVLGAFNPGQFANPFQVYFTSLDQMSQNASPMMGPMKAMARWQLECMGLMSRRAQAYMEIPSRLSRCRSPQDLIAEQTRFFQNAFQQYQESSKRIQDAWAQIGSTSLANGRDAAERDYISFADPKQANGKGRTKDRHAA